MLLSKFRENLALLREEQDRGDVAGGLIVSGIILVVVAIIVAIILTIVYFANTYGSTDGGHVAIVRNGGPFDNTQIRQVLPPNSGHVNIGEFSTMHDYPVSQRYFTISSSGQLADSNESVTVPTSDGVNIGIEGTAYFTLNTSPANNYKVLKDFDNHYGTRTFTCTPAGGNRVITTHVYNGDDGFSCFLDVMVAPIINNDLRQAIGDLSCAQLVASCSLVHNTNISATQNSTGGNVNLAAVEQQISNSLQSDLDKTLGEQYLSFQRFNLAKIDLPTNVQAAIDDAQAANVQAAKAQAQQRTALVQAQTKLKQAQIEAQANKVRQQGYNNCTTCAEIDKEHALPPGLLVLGSSSGVNLNLPTK